MIESKKIRCQEVKLLMSQKILNSHLETCPEFQINAQKFGEKEAKTFKKP